MEKPVEVGAVCSTCHASLHAGDRCLVCLLRGGLSEEILIDAPLSAGETVYGDFEIARRDDGSLWELGRGAMGVTYKAIDRVLHRPVALKVIQLGGAAARDRRLSEALRERFLREARAAAALRHANVAGIFHFGASDEAGRCFYAMELVEGETLEARVRRDGPLDVDTALEVVGQVAAALVAAASRKLIHRDLKPGNLMLSGSGGAAGELEVKVIDFGLAKAAGLGETDLTHGGFVGTPAYASPEQFARQPLDARSDLYSLGVTLWYALTGKAPFTGRSLEELSHHPARLQLPVEQLAARSVPACVGAILRRVLALDPTERPASAKELATALEACRRQLRAATVASATRQIPDKSIAVLPFENLSADPENAFFVEGVHDEILTDLARIADLKVISRTSVMQYKTAAKRNLREIAGELGVAHIVEGSVQRAGNRIRLRAQLIDARTDLHLWAEKFDRPLDDVFAIQSEIAQAVAEQLHAKLSPAEKAAIEEPPTSNLIAYDRYLRGKKALTQIIFDSREIEHLRQAIRLLDQAVAYDPKFYLAYCQLSRTHEYLYFMGADHTQSRLAQARQALEKALALAPEGGEAHLAAAAIAYHCERDYETALAELAIARRSLPNESSIVEFTSFIARRRGQWEVSVQNAARAEELDPRNDALLQVLSTTYWLLRRYSEMGRALDRAITISPRDATTRVARALLDLEEQADTQPGYTAINTVIGEDPSAMEAIADQWFYFALCRRDAGEMARALASMSPEGMVPIAVRMPRNYCEGLAARAQNDAPAAERAFTSACEEMEKLVREQPDYAEALSVLGMTEAALGCKEAALFHGRRAVDLFPVSKDAVTGAEILRNLAITYAWLGEKDLAMNQLQEVVRIPGPISYGQFRLHPWWDPLRDDPRFEALVVSLAPKP